MLCCAAAPRPPTRQLPGGLILPPSSFAGSRSDLVGVASSPLALPAIKSRTHIAQGSAHGSGPQLSDMNSDEHASLNGAPAFSGTIRRYDGSDSPSAEQCVLLIPVLFVGDALYSLTSMFYSFYITFFFGTKKTRRKGESRSRT
jgi:hypothetical protein